MISDNNIIYNGFFAGDLNSIPTENVFSHLDPERLRVASSFAAPAVSFELGLAWKQVANSLGYPVDPAKNPLRNYNDFVKDLVVRIGKYPNGQVPADIREILDLAMKQAPSVVQVCKLQAFVKFKDLVVRIGKYPNGQVPADIQEILDLPKAQAPSVVQVCKLQEFIKARDTLVVWEKVVKQANITVDFSKAYESAEVAIKRAKSFTDWIGKNSVKLQELTSLNLEDNQLTSIPKELGELGKLDCLILSKNQLTSIPEELGALGELTLLDLSNNQLTSIPKELGKLGKLRLLNLSCNQIASIPEKLGALRELIYLFLSDNKITSIPERLRRPDLQVLGKLQSAHIDPSRD